MHRPGHKLIVLMAFIILSCSTAYANTITVTPSNMGAYGWSEVHANGGDGFITNGGPCLNEGNPFPEGQGAFYAQCSYQGQVQTETPSTVWLGIDQHNGAPIAGIKLNRLAGLSYTTYVSTFPTIMSSVMKGPREPIQLQITILKDGINRRVLMNRPLLSGYSGVEAAQGDSSLTNCGVWQTWDAINGVWYEPITNSIYYGWASVLAAFPNGTLVPTSTGFNTADPLGWKSTGFDGSTEPVGAVASTGTGKPINLVVGARKYAAQKLMVSSGGYTWWPESVGFRGYVDTVTIGVNYSTDGEPNVILNTFDFEPDPGTPDPAVYALNGSSAAGSPVWNGTLASHHKVRWKVFGTVTATGEISSHTYFDINDGSSTGVPPYPIRVFAPGSSVQPGDYVSVVGDLRTFQWDTDPKQMILWSDVSNLTIYNR